MSYWKLLALALEQDGPRLNLNAWRTYERPRPTPYPTPDCYAARRSTHQNITPRRKRIIEAQLAGYMVEEE